MILIALAYVLLSLSFYGVIHLTGVCTKGWRRSYAATAGNYWRCCQPDLTATSRIGDGGAAEGSRCHNTTFWGHMTSLVMFPFNSPWVFPICFFTQFSSTTHHLFIYLFIYLFLYFFIYLLLWINKSRQTRDWTGNLQLATVHTLQMTDIRTKHCSISATVPLIRLAKN